MIFILLFECGTWFRPYFNSVVLTFFFDLFCFISNSAEPKQVKHEGHAFPPKEPSCAESGSSTPLISGELKYSSKLRIFMFNDLKLATRNFRPESLLGEGGFGCVFKGWIEENGTAPVKPGTGLTVAVKTLNPDGLQGHKEWLVMTNLFTLIVVTVLCFGFYGQLLIIFLLMGRLRLTSLETSFTQVLLNWWAIAWKKIKDCSFTSLCLGGVWRTIFSEVCQSQTVAHLLVLRALRILVYLLYFFVFHFDLGTLPLPWSVRMKIALGAAKGLAFLHEEAEKPVIYRDFKTSNILLDAVCLKPKSSIKLHNSSFYSLHSYCYWKQMFLFQEYNAKLSDFGLAKDAPDEKKSHVSTRVMGTYGYAAPEYVMTGE